VIIKDALAYSIQLLTSEEVDKYNPKRASIIGMERGIEEIKPDITLIDAERINPKYKQESIIKGDSKSITIAAASILAKVYRDRYMRELDKKFPQYNFAKNKGYGTKDHMIALEKYGIINEHRKSYKPIKKYCD
jgi:ribonuclease HII